MRTLVLLTALLFSCSLVIGCSSNLTDDSDAVFLRIGNASSSDFSSVFVRFPGVEASFDAVSSGQVSEYQRVESAYRYGYVEIEVSGQSYHLQPIDYVGEEPLESGRYTYKLGIEGDGLSFQFERD